jgi:hypothetical protein
MAETKGDARNILLDHLEKGRKAEVELTLSAFGRNKDKDFYMKQVYDKWAELLKIDEKFDIKEFGPGEILETEYA